MDAIRQLLTRLGELAAHPGGFGILVAYAVLWFIIDPESKIDEKEPEDIVRHRTEARAEDYSVPTLCESLRCPLEHEHAAIRPSSPAVLACHGAPRAELAAS